MASRYIFTTKLNPTPDDFSVATSGGTITGASGAVELVFDDAVFTGANGKIALIRAVEQMLNVIKQQSSTWPLT